MLTENKTIFVTILILMSAAGLVASDICLPALPEMAIYFDCRQTDIQASVAIFLFALAGSQLAYGALSDRFGRKAILIFAFTLFTIASFLSAGATTLSQFLFFRGLQAIGAGAGSVLSRTIIVERFNKVDTIKMFTTIFPIVGLSPAIAPFVGGYLSYFWGWKASFYAMALFGIVVIFAVMMFLQDKPALKRQRDTEQTKALGQEQAVYGYFHVLRNTTFLGYALILCISYSVFRCYTTESPFVFDRQGFVAQEIGYFYITLSAAYVLGNLGAKKLVTVWSVDRALSMGFLFFVLGGVSLAGSSYLFSESPLAIIIPMSIIALGNGFLFPIGSGAAMSSVPSHFSGGASGLLGSLQLSIAALSVYYIGMVSGGNAFSMALYLLGMISFGFFSFIWVVWVVRVKNKG